VGGRGEDVGGWFYAKLPTLSKRDFELKQWQWITSDMGNIFIFNIYNFFRGGKNLRKFHLSSVKSN
jgi:hypothetical protein